jgi:hypothetical protein
MKNQKHGPTMGGERAPIPNIKEILICTFTNKESKEPSKRSSLSNKKHR